MLPLWTAAHTHELTCPIIPDGQIPCCHPGATSRLKISAFSAMVSYEGVSPDLQTWALLGESFGWFVLCLSSRLLP